MKAKAYSALAGLGKLSREELKERNLELYGRKIKKYRTSAGLTPEELADKLQLSKSTVRNWECGLTRPELDLLYALFEILDIEPNEFFGIKGIGRILTPDEKNLIDDYRLVHYCTQIRNGDIGIFYVPGRGGIIKQKLQDRLRSINPEYDDIFPYEDGADVIEKVIGKVERYMVPGVAEQGLYIEALKEPAVTEVQ